MQAPTQRICWGVAIAGFILVALGLALLWGFMAAPDEVTANRFLIATASVAGIGLVAVAIGLCYAVDMK